MDDATLHSKHAELGMRVLSAWFSDAKFRAAWMLDQSVFALENQRTVAGVVAARGAPIGMAEVAAILVKTGKLKACWESAQAMFDELSGPHLLDPWAELELLREVATLRQGRQNVAEALRTSENLSDFRSRVSEALSASNAASGVKAASFRELMVEAYTRATEKTSGKLGIRTISRELDRTTGGFRRGMVWLQGSLRSWGKTSLLVALADQAWRDGARTLIVSAEDPSELFGRRLLQLRADVDAKSIRDRTMSGAEHSAISREVADKNPGGLFINAIGRPAESVAADIRSIVASDKVELVLVDYIQAIRAGGQQDRRNEVNHVGRLITDAIKQGGASGCIFSQLTEGEGGKLRARESADLENAAEVVIWGRVDNDSGAKRLWIEKVKDGPAQAWCELDWDPRTASFRSDYQKKPEEWQGDWAV